MEIIGDAPHLSGLLCESFICEGFIDNGKHVADANVIFVRFAGKWHKLIIDCGVIIWRKLDAVPQPWMVESEGWDYPHVDVGTDAGVIGKCLAHYHMETNAGTTRVTFKFDNARCITIRNENDLSTYEID
jgi:hypothetical protein